MKVYKPNTPDERRWDSLPVSFLHEGIKVHAQAVEAAGNFNPATYDMYEGTISSPPFDPLKERLVDAAWVCDNDLMTATMTQQVVTLSADERATAIDVEAQSRVDTVTGDQRQKNLKFMGALRQFRNARRGNNVNDALLDSLEVEAQLVESIYNHAEALKADPDLDADWPS